MVRKSISSRSNGGHVIGIPFPGEPENFDRAWLLNDTVSRNGESNPAVFDGDNNQT